MKTINAVVALAMALLLTGCGGGDNPTSISKEIANNMRAMTAVFNGITDEASAKAAVPKIEALRTDMRAVAARAKAMPKLNAAEMAEAETAAAKEMESVMKPLMESRAKLQDVFDNNPKVLEILTPALTGMENDM